MKDNNALKFDVVTGVPSGEKLSSEMPAGYSLLIEGNRYYVMRLHLFKNYFFVVKNQGPEDEYTVYRSKLPEKSVFKNPIGTATLRQDFKFYLEIDIPLLGCPVYMSLFPRQE